MTPDETLAHILSRLSLMDQMWLTTYIEYAKVNTPIWINIEDELPEYHKEVLVEVDGHRGPSWRNNHMLVAFLAIDNKFYEERHPSDEPLSVTHWTSLPEPPHDKNS